MSGSRLPFPRRLRRRAYWLAALALTGLAAGMPIGAGRYAGRALARVALRLRPREATRARRNLAEAFPNLSSPAIDALLADGIDALGRNLFDGLAARRLLGRATAVVGEPSPPGGGVIDVLEDLLARGRGVLILTGHIGCWELLGGWLSQGLAARGAGRLAVVTGTIHNPAVDRLVQARRRDLGLKILPREEGVRPVLRHLRAGGAVAVLLDQNTRTGNLPIPFFGRPAPTPAGLARIALRNEVPVLPVSIAWDSGRRCHVVRNLSPLPVPVRCGPDDAAVREMLTAANASLETFVRGNPAEWVWFHDRWDDEASRSSSPDKENRT